MASERTVCTEALPRLHLSCFSPMLILLTFSLPFVLGCSRLVESSRVDWVSRGCTTLKKKHIDMVARFSVFNLPKRCYVLSVCQNVIKMYDESYTGVLTCLLSYISMVTPYVCHCMTDKATTPLSFLHT